MQYSLQASSREHKGLILLTRGQGVYRLEQGVQLSTPVHCRPSTPAGAFVGTQSYSLNQADLIAAAVAGDDIFIDVSVETPNQTDFATLRTGISSDKGFEESLDKPCQLMAL